MERIPFGIKQSIFTPTTTHIWHQQPCGLDHGLRDKLTPYTSILPLLDRAVSSLLDGARPRSLPAGSYEPLCRPRYTEKAVYLYPDLQPKFGTIVTQIGYHCVRSIFVHVEKNIPLQSMPTNSRYQHLNLLSERRQPFCFMSRQRHQTNPCGLYDCPSKFLITSAYPFYQKTRIWEIP